MDSLTKLWLPFANIVEFTIRFNCILIRSSFVVIYNGSYGIRQESFVGFVVRM